MQRLQQDIVCPCCAKTFEIIIYTRHKKPTEIHLDVDTGIDIIVEEAAKINKISAQRLYSKSRERPIVQARQFVFKYIRDHMGWSLAQIGHVFGKDHATVLAGERSITNVIGTNYLIRELYHKYRDGLHAIREQNKYLLTKK